MLSRAPHCRMYIYINAALLIINEINVTSSWLRKEQLTNELHDLLSLPVPPQGQPRRRRSRALTTADFSRIGSAGASRNSVILPPIAFPSPSSSRKLGNNCRFGTGCYIVTEKRVHLTRQTCGGMRGNPTTLSNQSGRQKQANTGYCFDKQFCETEKS